MPGPPPALDMRYADDVVRVVQAQWPYQADEESEDSELERGSTSSGEYTIRERSSDSSGGYQGSLGQNPGTPSSVRGGLQVGTSAGLFAAVASQAVNQVDGKAVVAWVSSEAVDDQGSCQGASWFWLVLSSLSVGWIVGVGCAMMCACALGCKQRSEVQIQVESHVAVSTPKTKAGYNEDSNATDFSQNSSSQKGLCGTVRSRATNHQRTTVFLTENGKCVHLSSSCSTLRGATVQERFVCKRCSGGS